MHLVIESNLLQPKFMPPKDPSTHALSAPVRWEYPETPAVERGNTVENKNALQQQQHKQQTTTGQGAGTTRTRTAITAIITISTITVEQVRIIHSILGILTMGTEIPMNLLMTPSPGDGPHHPSPPRCGASSHPWSQGDQCQSAEGFCWRFRGGSLLVEDCFSMVLRWLKGSAK